MFPNDLPAYLVYMLAYLVCMPAYRVYMPVRQLACLLNPIIFVAINTESALF